MDMLLERDSSSDIYFIIDIVKFIEYDKIPKVLFFNNTTHHILNEFSLKPTQR